MLYCFKAKNLPQNLLVVLESLPEIKYGCRPVGAHDEVFRFLLGIVINSAPVTDRLEDRQCLSDLLRSHPKLLSSMLSLERRTNSKAVQNKLLRSLGESVARLEPPSRKCCTKSSTNRCCDCCTTSSRARFMLTCATGLSYI